MALTTRLGFLGQTAAKLGDAWAGREPEHDDEGSWERWSEGRAFELADHIEQGLVNELEQDFTMPVRRSAGLWQFHIERSDDLLDYKLCSADGAFLLYARVFSASDAGDCADQAVRVEFFLYGPESDLCDFRRPAFVMSSNAQKTEWNLWQVRCERCQLSPRSAACACRGWQQLAAISHDRRRVGRGIANGMELIIPGVEEDGSPVVWCPLIGRGDLRTAFDAERPRGGAAAGQGRGGPERRRFCCGPAPRRFCTRRPQWDAAEGVLRLDFEGRQVETSVKNFQLAAGGRKGVEDVLCQFGKLSPSTFALDIGYPLSVVQAFGAALSTLFWH